MVEEPQFVNWRASLRARRRELGLSVPEVARRSGLSASAIKAYESGARQPTAASLGSLIDALGMTREEANPIRAGAGFAVDWYTVLNERFTPDSGWLMNAVHRYPWPVFVANQGFDLVAANGLFEVVLGIDLATEFTKPGERNWLAQASSERFAASVENYDELVSFMIGLTKGDPRWSQNPERVAPWLQAPLERFLEGDAQYIKRFLELWEKAAPVPHRTRHLYEVQWRHAKGLLKFHGVLTIADLWNELSWNDWIPADEATRAAVAEMMERP